MNEPDEDLAKASEALDELDDAPGTTKDELTDILSPHFNIESMVRDTGTIINLLFIIIIILIISYIFIRFT